MIGKSLKRHLAILGLLSVIACGQQKSRKITVATAANMEFTMKKLAKAFEDSTAIKCEIIIGSSGKLTAQIKAGAPYQVFVAANVMYPNKLYQQGLIRTKPKIYAYGKLVIWSLKDSSLTSFSGLLNNSVKHIAVANPKTAPYGVASIQALKNAGIYEQVKSKLVFGESISQTNQFISSQSAEVGFTAMSVVVSDKMRGRGSWKEVNPDLYSPITQGVALVKQKPENPDAQRFYDFLSSAKAKNILTSDGYRVK